LNASDSPASLAVAPPADTSHVLGLAAAPGAAPAAEPEPDGDQPKRRRRRWWWVAAAVLLAAGALAAALVLVSSTAEVTVPALIGQSETVAVHKLKALGLVPGLHQASSVIVPAGTVLAQSPPVGTVVHKGSHVSVTISSGPANVAVPNVVGKSQSRALTLLRGRSLNPAVQAQPSRRVGPGDVISTTPSAGTVVLQGSAVTVFVSSGPAGGTGPAVVRVPDVRGSTLQTATEELTAAQLVVGSVTRRGSSSPPGTVISQIPVPGASLVSGGAVNLVVAEPQHVAEEVIVPNVVQEGHTKAAAELGKAGLNPTESVRAVTDPAENGVVIEMSPEAGQTVKRGTTIMIVVGKLEQSVSTTTTATERPPA
jgi:serine/threonine-protein kinase